MSRPPPPVPVAPTRGAIVLAGGRSERMGADKAFLDVGGTTMLARVVGAVAAAAGEVVVVARCGQPLPPLDALPDGAVVRRVDDEVEGRGPVGGLAAGFQASRADVVFVAACDLPFLTPAFAAGMLDALGDADAAVPEQAGRLHPLASAWRRVPALAAARAALGAPSARVTDVLARLRTVRLDEAALARRGLSPAALRNVNTPDELDAARRAP